MDPTLDENEVYKIVGRLFLQNEAKSKNFTTLFTSLQQQNKELLAENDSLKLKIAQLESEPSLGSV